MKRGGLFLILTLLFTVGLVAPASAQDAIDDAYVGPDTPSALPDGESIPVETSGTAATAEPATAAQAESSALAFTGGDITVLVLIAGALIGGGVLLASRRRATVDA